jgi:hypothetical protein
VTALRLASSHHFSLPSQFDTRIVNSFQAMQGFLRVRRMLSSSGCSSLTLAPLQVFGVYNEATSKYRIETVFQQLRQLPRGIRYGLSFF